MKKKERKVLLEVIAMTIAKCDGLKTKGRTFADSAVYGPTAKAVLAALDVHRMSTPLPDPEEVARVIWETSRRDEGTISVTGADIVAHAVMPLFVGCTRECDLVWYDEETLHKVYGALRKSGASDAEADEAINQMQNAGILFRERAMS